MKFSYSQYGEELRPVVPLLVCNPKTREEFGYTALVDSGAEVCLFNFEVAEALGLTPKDANDTLSVGIGGKNVECSAYTINFNIAGWSHTTEVYILSKKDDRKIPYGLVGQKGFFQFFKITFDRARETFEIQK